MRIFNIAIALIAMVLIADARSVSDARNARAQDRRKLAVDTNTVAAVAATTTTIQRRSPQTITMGSVTLEKCLEGNSFGVHDFFCVNFTVPVDYAQPEGDKMAVTFIVHLADGMPFNPQTGAVGRKAMAMPAGGPGTIMHTNMAPKYVNSFGPNEGMQLAVNYDLIFIDQRGMGWSCGMWCVNAYQLLTVAALNPDNVTAYSEVVAAHPARCLQEMEADPRQTASPCIIGSNLSPVAQRTKVIPFVGTRNAARDLESFRAAAGYQKLWVHGRSYGTTVAQVYAALFPYSTEGITLDSAIDMTVPIADQDAELVGRRAAFLYRTIELCLEDAVCHADVTDGLELMTPRQIVEKALGIASVWPATVRIPEFGAKAGQSWVTRKIFRWHLEYAVLNWEASPWSRGDVARAILRSAKGNPLSLLRMLWGAWGMDVATETVDVDATLAFTDEYTIYPMVYGNDYSYRYRRAPVGAITAFERTNQYFARNDDVLSGAMGTTYMMDAQGAAYNKPTDPISTPTLINATVPSPGWHGNYKILIVGPSIDPFTADTDAANLFARYMTTGQTTRIILKDGPHVSSGKTWIEGPDPGFYCVNNAVDTFVINTPVDSKAAPQLITCDMALPLQNYIPLTPRNVVSAREAVRWFDAETVNLGEFRWYSTTAAGCDIKGSVSWTGSANWRYDLFTFTDCQFFPGFSATGTGSYDWLSSDFYELGADVTLDLAVTNTDTGAVTCFNYNHVAGMEPTTTLKAC